jgi:hypothetical protein
MNARKTCGSLPSGGMTACGALASLFIRCSAGGGSAGPPDQSCAASKPGQPDKAADAVACSGLRCFESHHNRRIAVGTSPAMTAQA